MRARTIAQLQLNAAYEASGEVGHARNDVSEVMGQRGKYPEQNVYCSEIIDRGFQE